jgi:hypothetical protein
VSPEFGTVLKILTHDRLTSLSQALIAGTAVLLAGTALVRLSEQLRTGRPTSSRESRSVQSGSLARATVTCVL